MMIGGRRRAALLLTGLAVAGGLSSCGLMGRGDRGEFCALLEQAYPAYRLEPVEARGPNAGASEWKAYFDVTHQRNQQLIAVAPRQISAALTSLQATNDRMADFYAEAEYTPDQIDSGALSQLHQDSGYQQAVRSVTAYARDTCKIDTGDPTPASA